MKTPTCEKETIEYFLEIAKEYGWSVVSLGTAFPDAVLSHNGHQYRTEFEYKASNLDAG